MKMIKLVLIFLLAINSFSISVKLKEKIKIDGLVKEGNSNKKIEEDLTSIITSIGININIREGDYFNNHKYFSLSEINNPENYHEHCSIIAKTETGDCLQLHQVLLKNNEIIENKIAIQINYVDCQKYFSFSSIDIELKKNTLTMQKIIEQIAPSFFSSPKISSPVLDEEIIDKQKKHIINQKNQKIQIYDLSTLIIHDTKNTKNYLNYQYKNIINAFDVEEFIDQNLNLKPNEINCITFVLKAIKILEGKYFKFKNFEQTFIEKLHYKVRSLMKFINRQKKLFN